MRTIGLVLGLAFLLPARAATVEVSVRERMAGPLADQPVVLQPLAAPGEIPSYKRSASGVTGANGKVIFESVPIGRFAVSLGRIALPGLIDPAANPLAPPPQITVATAEDRISVEVEVWRGSLLTSELIVDRASIPKRAQLVLRGLDGQPGADLALDVQGRVERLLLPGRYEMELVAPSGYLLVDVVWNGESLPGHVVRFDVREDPRRQSVSWYLSAPCLVTGTITDQAGGCPVQVVARLVEPGAWIQAAVQRGGSNFQIVPHQEWVDNSKCVYRLWLPDGRWSVQPHGADLLSSEPDSADVTLAPGETRVLDFELQTKDADDATKGQPLIVAVLSPEGRRLTGAIVEIREPLKTGRTEGYGGAVRFRGLAAGDYVATAGRAEFLESTQRVEKYDPEAREPTKVTITLREGAKLHARALDDDDRPVQGVELRYTRLSPLPKMALTDEAVVTRKQSGSATTDVTGHVEIQGLYSGDYTLEARMTGERSSTRFVLLRQGGAKHRRSIAVSLAEGERSDVDLIVLPAASLSGGLACSDGGTMPPKVSFRVFPADAPVEGLWRDQELRSGAVIASNDVVLRGAGADRFQLGPLSPGAYRLAARPAGQRYWSWASNELMPDRTTVFSFLDATTVDAGVVEIECGPLVAVVPGIKSEEPLPDMRLGATHASLRPAGEEKPRRRVSAEVEKHADRVFLRRLPEGKLQMELTLEHPYLVPPSISVPQQTLELTRGNVAEIPVNFDRLGGMVEVRGDGKAARLTPGEGDPVVRPIAGGKAAFPGTIPGIYGVELCGDSDCLVVTATFTRVTVLAGRTAFLP